MSGETATAKRVSRTLRASPVKEGTNSRTPIPREDVENLSAVTLAALGMPAGKHTGKMQATTPQAGDRMHKRMSKTSSEMYATPPSTVMPVKGRTVSSTSHVSSGNNNHQSVHSSSRTRDRTIISSSLASSDVSSPHAHAQAPLTAIRRPAAQAHQHHQNTTPAGSRMASNSLSAARAVSGPMKSSPSSLSMSTNGSKSAARSRKASGNSSIAVSNNRDTPSSIRSRALSSDASKISQRDEVQAGLREKGVFVTQEEYSALIALLSAKDEQIAGLKAQVDEGLKEISGLEDRANRIKKERDVLMTEKKEFYKSRLPATAVAGKDASNSPQGEEAGISRKEYESFKKQYEMQENLLEGFQRENEKATVELEALKKREKILTEQLKKIYGPTFSLDNEINPLTPEQGVPSKRFPTSLMSNGHGTGSPLSGGMFIGEQHRRRSGFGLAQMPSKASPLSEEQRGDGTPIQAEEGTKVEIGSEHATRGMDVEPAILKEQLVSVQSLLERFEKRLLVRESELIKKEKEAAEQIAKLQSITVG